MESGKKVIMVELDPPYDANAQKIMDCAHLLKAAGVDMITFADSPMGKARADSIMMGIKVSNEVGIPVMPHIACRDKNVIAMRAGILGAYLNGIRNFLFVTGDPVPAENRSDVSGVFDFNSIKLMQYVSEMNTEHFREEPLVFDSIFHRREVTLDIDCTGPVDLRFRDADGNVALEVTALPGQAVSLAALERNKPYIVEMRGEPAIYLQFR